MFGQTNKSAFGSSGFGAQGAGGAFGTPNIFGTTATPAANNTGGLFGTTTTQQGNIFGAGTSTFGQTTTGGVFGGQQQTSKASLFSTTGQQSTNLFSTPASNGIGTKTPAPAAFGSAVQNTGAFGSSIGGGTSLFGSSNAGVSNPTSTLFGSANTSTVLAGQSGTTIKFNPPSGQDGVIKGGVSTNISTRHQCISSMKEYEAKSLEELRAEDYVVNRKGPQTGSAGVFTNPQTTQAQTSFSFGTQNKTPGFVGFSQTATSGGTSLFSQPQQAQSTGGLFSSGASNTKFGTTPSVGSTSFGGFGSGSSAIGQNTANKGLFGQPANTPVGGLFGTTQTASSAGNGFGSTQSSFGTNTQAGGLFSNKTTSFAQPAVSAGNTFGQQNTATTGGLFASKLPAGQSSTGINFGQTPATGFGTCSTGLFGNKTSGFGATNTLGATGFCQTATNLGIGANSGITGGLQNKPVLGGLNLSNPGLCQSVANNATLAQSLVLQNENEQVLNQLKKTLVYSPYGNSPLFRNLENNNVSREDLVKPTNPIAQKAALSSHNQYKVSPRPMARIKPKVLNTVPKEKCQLFDGLEEEDLSFGNVTFVPRRNVKKLTIKGGSPFNKPNSFTGTAELDTSRSLSIQQTPDIQEDDRQQVISTLKVEESPGFNSHPPVYKDLAPNGLFQNISESFLNDTISDFNHQASNCDNKTQMIGSPVKAHPAGVVLCRHGYYTSPSLETLAELIDKNGDCIVDDFVIGREGYGSVMFPGQTNVANLNLDEIVHFRRKEITIYPEDEEKPPTGTGLNKKAQITLHCVWPCDNNTKEYVKDVEKLAELHYQDKLERITAKIGANFLDYRPETGSWEFEVKHFSKYGLLDEDDDVDDGNNPDPKMLVHPKDQQHQLAVQKQQKKVTPSKPLPGQNDKLHLVECQQDSENKQDEIQILKDVPHLYPLMADKDFQVDFAEEDIIKEVVNFDEIDSSERAPTSHQLASHLGVMAEGLQLRKASFFGDEEFMPKWTDTAITEEKQLPWLARKSLLNTNYSTSSVRNHSPQISAQPQLLSTSFDRTFSTEQKSRLKVLEPIQLPTRAISKRKPVSWSYVKRAMPNLHQSLFVNRERLLMDLGLFQAKQFRIGWGPQWKLVHGGKLLNDSESYLGSVDDQPQKYKLLHKSDGIDRCRLGGDYQQLLIERLIVSPLHHKPPFQQTVIDHLTIQLRYSHIAIEFGSPHVVPCIGNTIINPLISCAQNAMNKLADSQEYDLYRQSELVWELCQALWGNLEDPLIEDLKPNSYAYQIARQDALSVWFEKAVLESVNQETEELKAKVGSEASVIFQHLTGHQLVEASSVAQLNGDHRLALLIAEASKVEDISKYISHQLVMWAQSEMDELIKSDRIKIYALLAGMFVWRTSSNQNVNVCENLDWKRAMAVHLWYFCQPTCTVSEALEAYSEAFDSRLDQSYAAPPLPPYLETLMETEAKQDVCFQLIKLFCDRSYPLHKLLNPTSAIPNCLDYRLSRENAVLELLIRHISLHPDDEEEECEQFLQDTLRIPTEWIHQAKAIRAGHCNEKEKEAWHWLKAGNWNKAHQLIISHLASRAIVNENCTDLKRLLNELASPEISCTVEDWDKGGCVFLDYITMMETLQQLQQSDPSVVELDKLQSDVCQLSRCLRGLKCYTATDRLCQSEMAKRTANLMRTLLQMKCNGTSINEMLVTETIDLPLPEDYALQELHQLTRCYMLGVTT
ncbi:hypothetical protein LSH36_3g17077 [Paralvinella palmiformis]|uniref:Nuclear pore complex protein Nup98-Nup96 n=1 Tax=Paralvinella palmiformis TaxID=53620 RepID=A0AAD9KFI1_9ANNE|nr:hypothetical protein LSH36_3g17077 [Paralvinella palmiformis]